MRAQCINSQASLYPPALKNTYRKPQQAGYHRFLMEDGPGAKNPLSSFLQFSKASSYWECRCHPKRV